MEFSDIECRVLGCLIEKERSTPQNYPLTLNALRLACNQSTNRDPVVAYDDHMIETALTDLRERKVTRIVYSTSNRAAKYRHVLDEVLHIGPDELAVLAVLLLRGPQTIGELNARTERLFPFRDLAAVQQTLDQLAAHPDGPLTVVLPRQPGQKDVRHAHLLGRHDPVAVSSSRAEAPSSDAPPRPSDTGAHRRPESATDDPIPPDAGVAGTPRTTAAVQPSGAHSSGAHSSDARIDANRTNGEIARLAAEVRRLETELHDLRTEFEQFRSQFD